jgi:pseudaminic acid cytidylyltransferase
VRVAVIPARGGSKRIPRKNIREFAGKPMIGHSIECALQSGLFDKVIVSTDDEEIASVARDCGAEVPFHRPQELADDRTGTAEVVAHATGWLQSHGLQLSAVCCIYATAPFVRATDLRRALTLLEGGSWRYVFSATTFAFPIFRSFKLKVAGSVEMYFPEHFETRSQDLAEALHDAGQFYWGTAQAWLQRARIFDQWSTVIQIPRWRVQDIDTPEDWEYAQIIWQTLRAAAADR